LNPEVAELVGVWSISAGYYSSFSDEWLIFRPDGMGRQVYLYPGENYSHHFRWQIVSPSVIDLIRLVRLVRDDGSDEKVVDEQNESYFLGIRYSVEEKERPPDTGQRMRVLRLEIGSPWPDELGFEREDYEFVESRLRGG